jgi:hypothetical protein
MDRDGREDRGQRKDGREEGERKTKRGISRRRQVEDMVNKEVRGERFFLRSRE